MQSSHAICTEELYGFNKLNNKGPFPKHPKTHTTYIQKAKLEMVTHAEQISDQHICQKNYTRGKS